MAFKRSAVRSRLSPPKNPENHWFSGFFLCQNRGLQPIKTFFQNWLAIGDSLATFFLERILNHDDFIKSNMFPWTPRPFFVKASLKRWTAS